MRFFNQIQTKTNTTLTSTTPILLVFPCNTRGRPNDDDDEEEKRHALKEKQEEEEERLTYAV